PTHFCSIPFFPRNSIDCAIISIIDLLNSSFGFVNFFTTAIASPIVDHPPPPASTCRRISFILCAGPALGFTLPPPPSPAPCRSSFPYSFSLLVVSPGPDSALLGSFWIEQYRSEIRKLQESEAEIKALSVNYTALLKEKECLQTAN
ncbi:unnamed protein product, partial [Linum tenue]